MCFECVHENTHKHQNNFLQTLCQNIIRSCLYLTAGIVEFCYLRRINFKKYVQSWTYNHFLQFQRDFIPQAKRGSFIYIIHKAIDFYSDKGP